MKLKYFIIAGLTLLNFACANNPSPTSKIDYADDVETPDSLLLEGEEQSMEFGEKDISLDPDAKENNQQVKPDLLVQDISTKKASSNKKTEPLDKHQSSVEKTKASEKSKSDKSVRPSKKNPSEQELEVPDPLLEEVDQG